MLESLQQMDPEIEQVIVYSKFVVHYLLQQNGPNPGWRKANLEGPVYVVRRKSAPKYQLLVKNQFNTNDLVDNMHPNWELDCQNNYVFYKVEDPGKRIRGLWFHDDAERRKVEAALEKTLEELRAAPAELQTEPTAAPTPAQPKAGRGLMGPPELAPPPPAAAIVADNTATEPLLAKPPGPLADSNQLDPFCSMVESLQQQDPDIDQIVVYSKFVVHYLLQQDGPSPGWRKANVEGPVYVVRRRSAPKYQLLVKNQFNTINNLVDDLHPNWELDCQTNYVFYKVDDPAKRIRGLWFHDDSERKKVENILLQTLEELRATPGEPQAPPMVTNPVQKASAAAAAPPDAAPPGMPPIDNNITSDSVTITMSSLRAALHALADDDQFLRTVMQKIKHSAPQ
jgi:hypothetical protein